jgi:peptidoglycan/xylan/chitin deacetylase (PgdA/CDA1 family)
VAVFYFHRTLSDATPAGDWRRVLGHPTAGELRAKIAYFKQHFELIGVRACVDLLARREPLRDNYAVLTVDDGYRDFRSQLLPVLEDLGAPATLFVCTGAVASGQTWFDPVYRLIEQVKGDRLWVPWMDRRVAFGDVLHRGLTVEHVLLPYLKRLRPACRQEQLEALYRANGIVPESNPADALCTVDDLRALSRSPLVELHLHSHQHQVFETLSEGELTRDLSACKEFFDQQLGLKTDVLSYPNGTCKPSQWPILTALGVRHAFSTQPGYELPSSSNPMALRRNSFGDETMDEFRWRVMQLLRQ